MPLMQPDPQADAIDLVDGVSCRLEQARAIAWAVAEQLERSALPAEQCAQLSGEMSAVYSQITEAQSLVESLAGKCGLRPHT